MGTVPLCKLVALLLPAAVLVGAAPGGRDSTHVTPAGELRLPADIVYGRVVGPDSAVVFSHRTHVMFAGNRCTGCHPQPFPMLKRAPAPGHRAMNAGELCGVCHDGKESFSVRDAPACGTCHSGTSARRLAAAGTPGNSAGASTALRVPRPHRYSRGEDSPGSVTFRHESHLRGAIGCVACHPKPFAMSSAPPLAAMGMHEPNACGSCHDGVKSFGIGNPKSCARCHLENGAGP